MNKETILLYSLYLGLNLINTFIISHKTLNKYIVPFKHTLKGELNALLGNLFTLNLFGLIILIFVKNLYWYSIVLIILSVILNLMLFALNVFNLYFGNAFTKDSIDMFKNPVKGMSKGMIKEILNELISYYRIILFIPTIILMMLISSIGQSNLYQEVIPIKNLWIFIGIFISLLGIFLTWINYEKMYLKDLTIGAIKSTYGIQNYGVYPFYLTSLFKFTSVPELLIKSKKKDFTELTYEYNLYNKNVSRYINFLNNMEYSNNLVEKKVPKSIRIDSSLINDNQSLNGIFKGKNLVLVQMESMSRFLLDIPLL